MANRRTEATAKTNATADPYGMTNKGTSNGNGNGNDNGNGDDDGDDDDDDDDSTHSQDRSEGVLFIL